MSKVTTIIDIGSNSIRMVVLQKSSRFAFSLINETKAKVKISEGSYENDSYLQELPMQRAYNALESFLSISSALKSRKIICVATSALRDAPNAKAFLSKVKKGLNLSIKIITGEKEAFYGGISTLNLIGIDDFMTIDIGGGSTEFAIVKNKKIEHTFSLNIGTVRLNELFLSKDNMSGAKEYILDKLSLLKQKSFDIPSTVISIGGTLRALSKVIMKKTSYPLNILHGFQYDVDKNKKVFNQIITASNKTIFKDLGIKKDRCDTIREGTLIFNTILQEFNITSVVSSGVGVREGVYLNDLLRSQNKVFPANYNISVRSLLDRFNVDSKISSYLGSNARKIFDELQSVHKLDLKYRAFLIIASKLHSIGRSLNFYKSNDNSFDFILHGLNYNFSQSSRVTIAHIIKYSKKSMPKEKDLFQYQELLPNIETMQWLSFMISLNLLINQDLSSPKVDYKLKNDKLIISFQKEIYFIANDIEKLEIPSNIKIKIDYETSNY